MKLPNPKGRGFFFLLPLDGGGFRWGWSLMFFPLTPAYRQAG